MVRHQIERNPVIDGERRVIGIVSVTDLVHATAAAHRGSSSSNRDPRRGQAGIHAGELAGRLTAPRARDAQCFAPLMPMRDLLRLRERLLRDHERQHAVLELAASRCPDRRRRGA